MGIRPVAKPLISSLDARLSADEPEKGRLLVIFPWHPILLTQIVSVHSDSDDTQKYSKILLFCRSSLGPHSCTNRYINAGMTSK